MLRATAGTWTVIAIKNGVPFPGDAANITAKIRKDSGARVATIDVNPTELEDGQCDFNITADENDAYKLNLYPESSTPGVTVIALPPVIYTSPAGIAAASASSTDGSQQVLESKAIITTYLTGQTLYWFPLSRSLDDWTTYRVQATESASPDLGRYSVTLESASADLTEDPDATFILFVGSAQPSSFTEGIQATDLVALPSSSGTRTVLATGPESSTLYWFPLSRSLNDWETYRTLATEASAPNTGRYSAVLSAVSADLTVDPYGTFVLFSGASQPTSINDGLRTVVLGASTTATTAATTTSVNYSILQQRVGKYLFGIRSGYSEDQQNDIKDCLNDGLRRVYAAYDWSFLHPLVDVTTTAPYATGTITIASGVVTLTGGTFPTWAASGVLKVNNRYYSVASRGSATQITLDTTSVTISTASSYQLARPEVELDEAFDAIAPDRDLTYYPSPDCWYPPVRSRHDSTIRQLESSNPTFDRPVFYSIRTVRFDPTVGSRKVLALYPTPDQVYTLRVPMILRPLLLDEINLYAIGAELLSQVILEACLASAEHNFEEREHVHEKRYMELIGLAIRDDQERSSPSELGPDIPRSERGRFGAIDDYRLREQRIGGITLDGTNL